VNAILRTLIITVLISATAQAVAMTGELQAVRSEWARIKYQLPDGQREQAFEALAERVHAESERNTDDAEALVWEAIVVASLAGEKGGLNALSLVKRARDLLLRAERIDPNVLEGSVYTSLGSLYYKVPGWPIGFGSDDKAREYLQKALSINPAGLDPNFFYGEFLMEQGEYRQAVGVLQKALQAAPRGDRPLADEGRRAEARSALESARAKL
jgi:tetratricopeptide (TPR) repeat protein